MHQRKMILRGKNHPRWLGDRVGYAGLHQWVTRNLGRPNKCEGCGKIENRRYYIQWANKSGRYLRELSDWERLCGKCHNKKDNIHEKVYKAAIKNGKIKPSQEVACRVCNKKFYAKYSHIIKGTVKYCSRRCMYNRSKIIKDKVQ